jgi:hypothetical protein
MCNFKLCSYVSGQQGADVTLAMSKKHCLTSYLTWLLPFSEKKTQEYPVIVT